MKKGAPGKGKAGAAVRAGARANGVERAVREREHDGCGGDGGG